MRSSIASLPACITFMLFLGHPCVAASTVKDEAIETRLTQWPETSIQIMFSDMGQPEVQFASIWPVGRRTFVSFDAAFEFDQGPRLSATNLSFGMFYRPHPGLLFGARANGTISKQGFLGSFTASTSWNGVIGGSFLSTSANVNYSQATGWGFDALASGDFPIGDDITGYAEVWLSGNGQLSWGAALGVTLPVLNGSEATFQIYRDYGEFPMRGFLAELYRPLGDNGSLTVSAAWDKDLSTGSRDFTLSFDTTLSLGSAAALSLSGKSVITDGRMFSSEAQLELTFEQENGSFTLSAAKSLGDYRDSTFAVEWVSRW